MNDWIEHRQSVVCLCRPRVRITNGTLIANHNALDGREEFEQKNGKGIPGCGWAIWNSQMR